MANNHCKFLKTISDYFIKYFIEVKKTYFIIITMDVNGMAKKGADRKAFLISLVGIVLSGLAILAIHNSVANVQRKRSLFLTKALWKFVPETDKHQAYTASCWRWRILLLVGIMLSCTVISVTSLSIGYAMSLLVGGFAFALWFIGITFFWIFVVMPIHNDLPIDGFESTTVQHKEKEKGNIDLKHGGWSKKVKDEKDHRLPVTIITGFLGSGKTTLVKDILSNTIGMKVLVIENEIGSEGIDHELLMQHTNKEEIILMNNGCVCCTVRKDLLSTFHRIFETDAFSRLDWVVIETTGLADPAPLIQSLYIDDKCKMQMRLDGVITVVDSKHFSMHLNQQKDGLDKLSNSSSQSAHGGPSEARLQVAFADRILMNKSDLLASDPAELDKVIGSVQVINPHAKLFVCEHSRIPIEDLLNIRAFDTSRNEALLRTMKDETGYDISDTRPILIQRDVSGKIIQKKVKLNIPNVPVKLNDQNRGICTISLTCDEPLDLDLFNEWIASVLREKGENLYRTKGILWMAGYNQQFVAQGVHMIFDGERGPTWDGGLDKKRFSKLVFIGLQLNASALEKGFRACCAENQSRK